MNTNKTVMSHISAVIAATRASMSESGAQWLGYDLARIAELEQRYDELAAGATPWPDEVIEALRP